METKQNVFDEICHILAISDLEMGTAGSIPRRFFSALCEEFGFPDSGNAIEVSRRIVVDAGLEWDSAADSSSSPSGGGGTITLKGLQLLLQAVTIFLDRRDSHFVANIAHYPQSGPTEWTMLEGQHTTRSNLSSRFGISQIGDVSVSAWSDNIFVFVDHGSDRIVGRTGATGNHVTLRFPLTHIDERGQVSPQLQYLLNHRSSQKNVRLFVGTSGRVQYQGKFLVSREELQWANDSHSEVLISLVRAASQSSSDAGSIVDLGERESSPILGIEYEPVEHLHSLGSEPIPFEIDPDLLDRALRSHAFAQNFLANWLSGQGIQPKSPGQSSPQFDLLWTVGSQVFVAEVKSIRDENERQQFRLGLGQVLDYAQELDASPVLFLSRPPVSPRLVAIASRANVLLLWPELVDEMHQSSSTVESIGKRLRIDPGT